MCAELDVDASRQRNQLLMRNGHELGLATWSGDADVRRGGAQQGVAEPARLAGSAGDERVDGDGLADRPAVHVPADGGDGAGQLVTENLASHAGLMR
jgi:hypothetical protein